MENETQVDLPPYVTEPYEIYVNGVPQVAGTDYRVVGSSLFFERALAQEGRLGLWRWVRLFFGIAGSYRKHDSVDVIFTHDGRRTVVSLAPVVREADGGQTP